MFPSVSNENADRRSITSNDSTQREVDHLYLLFTYFHPINIDLSMFRNAADFGMDYEYPSAIRRVFLSENGEDRFSSTVAELIERNMAVWIEEGSVISITENCPVARNILHTNPDLDLVYRDTAIYIISISCIVISGQPPMRFMESHMDIYRMRGCRELSQGRNVELWVEIFCSLGFGYSSRGNINMAYEVWVAAMKSDMQCWIAKTQLALLNVLFRPIDQYIEEADFLMWSALKHGTSDEIHIFGLLLAQRLVEYASDQAATRRIERLKGILNCIVSLAKYNVDYADRDDHDQ